MFSIIILIGKEIVCNYHEAEEGRCDLDRFFGIMTGVERRSTIKGIDITGNTFLLVITFSFHLGTQGYISAWSTLHDLTVTSFSLNRDSEPNYNCKLLGDGKQKLRQIWYDPVDKALKYRLVYLLSLHSLLKF